MPWMSSLTTYINCSFGLSFFLFLCCSFSQSFPQYTQYLSTTHFHINSPNLFHFSVNSPTLTVPMIYAFQVLFILFHSKHKPQQFLTTSLHPVFDITVLATNSCISSFQILLDICIISVHAP